MLKLAKKHLKSALLAGMLLAAFSFLALVMTQKNFRSSADILVSQNAPGVTDYYNLSQSANYLTTVLSQSVYSEKFLEDVIATGKVSGDIVSGDNAARLKSWQKLVRVKTNPNIGIMTVEVFGDTQYQTDQLAAAVLDVLSNQNSFFLGQEKNVDVRALSGPITQKNPTGTQIALAVVGGFAAGALLFILFVIYREEIFTAKEEKEEAFISYDEEYDDEDRIYPLKSLPEKTAEEERSISDEDYLSATSDYWKKRLEDNQA